MPQNKDTRGSRVAGAIDLGIQGAEKGGKYFGKYGALAGGVAGTLLGYLSKFDQDKRLAQLNYLIAASPKEEIPEIKKEALTLGYVFDGKKGKFVDTDPLKVANKELKGELKGDKKELKTLGKQLKSEEKQLKKATKGIDKQIKKSEPLMRKKLEKDKAKIADQYKAKIDGFHKNIDNLHKKMSPEGQADRRREIVAKVDPERAYDALRRGTKDGKVQEGGISGYGNNLNVTAEKNAAQNYLLNYGMDQLKNEKQYDFEPIEQISKNRFQRETIPSIMERFGQSSSVAAQAAAAAGVDHRLHLDALRQEHGLEKQKMNRALFGYGLANLEPRGGTQNAGPTAQQQLGNTLANIDYEGLSDSAKNAFNSWKDRRDNKKAVQEQEMQSRLADYRDRKEAEKGFQTPPMTQQQQLEDTGRQMKYSPGSWANNQSAEDILKRPLGM